MMTSLVWNRSPATRHRFDNKASIEVTLRPPKPSRFEKLGRNKAQAVEMFSRALFPFLFICFNLLYWPYYLS